MAHHASYQLECRFCEEDGGVEVDDEWKKKKSLASKPKNRKILSLLSPLAPVMLSLNLVSLCRSRSAMHSPNGLEEKEQK